MRRGAEVDVERALEPVGFVARDLPRLGLVLLSTDLTTERDVARAIPPDQAGVHATRVAHVNPTTPENLRRMLPHLTSAAEMILPGLRLEAICYACTAATSVLGEEAVALSIHAARPGVRVVTPTGAAGRAFADLGVRRIALLTPYLPETTRPVLDVFDRSGIDVVRATCLGLEDDRDMARVDRATILAAAEAADHREAEALFISCTALPAMELAGQIESRIGKPVVTSNQACVRELRAAAGLRGVLPDLGRVMAVPCMQRPGQGVAI